MSSALNHIFEDFRYINQISFFRINYISVKDLLRDYKCPDCKRIFPFDFLLAKHQKNDHQIDMEPAFVDCSLPELPENNEFLDNEESCSSSQSRTLSPLQSSRLQCDICFKTFLKFRYVNEHKRRAHKIAKLKCPECDRPYNNTANLRKHLVEAHDYEEDQSREILEGPRKSGYYKCLRCDKSFNFKKKLKNHQEQDHTHGVFNAETRVERKKRVETLDADAINKMFDDLFTKLSKEAEVLKDNKSSNKVFECDICQKTYTLKRYLTEHMRYSHQNGQFNCPKCDKNYHVKGAFLNHIKLRHPKYRGNELKKAVFTCEICKKVLINKLGYKHHMDNHNLEKKYPCPICHNGSYSKIGMQCHKRMYHLQQLQEPTIPCPEPGCTLKFHTPSLLKVHSNTHLEANLKCPKCPKLFKRADTLRRHIQQGHSEQDEYKCSFLNCLKVFKEWKSYKNHSKKHDKIEKFECGFCLKIFIASDSLKKHLKTHEVRERVHPCDACDMRFFSIKIRDEHFQNRHTGKTKDVQCTFTGCNEKFFFQRQMVRHMRNRHNKQFECFLCSKSFGFQYLLNRHLHINHQE